MSLFGKAQSALSVALVFGLLGGCATTGTSSSSVGGVEVKGATDNLEPTIEVSTFSYDRPFMGIVNPSDYFLRGYITKSSGLKDYQLYVITNRTDWMNWNRVRFMLNGQLVELKANRVGYDVQCGQYGCPHYEDTVVHLTADMLSDLSKEQSDVTVRLVSSRFSDTLDIQVDPKEVRQFLAEMNNH